MMDPRLALTFACLCFLTQVLLLARIFASKQAGHWPSLVCFLLTDVLSAPILAWSLGHRGRYTIYFFTYWIANAIGTALRLWMIADVARSFRGLDFLPKRFTLFVLIAALSAAIFSGWYAHAIAPRDAALTALKYWRLSADFGWMAFAAVLLSTVRLFNFAWSPLGSRVATALMLQIMINGLTSLMPNATRAERTEAFLVNSVCYAATLIFLARAFRAGRPQPAASPAASLDQLSNRALRES